MRALALWLLVLASCDPGDSERQAAAEPTPAAVEFDGARSTGADQLKHGERLTWVLGCRGCHAPDLRGQLWDENPQEYGVTWSPNLTRSVHAMTEAQLRGVIFDGKHPRRPRLWYMPSELFHPLSAADRDALVAYLRTLAPAGEASPDPILGPRAEREIAEGKIKPADMLVAEAGSALPADLGPRHALGRHITIVSCAECHGRRLEGHKDDSGATPDLLIAGAYSRDEFRALTTEGTAKDGRKIDPLMVSVGKNRLSRLTERERNALYDYLVARAEQP